MKALLRIILLMPAAAAFYYGIADVAGLSDANQPKAIEYSELWNEEPYQGYCQIGPHVADYDSSVYSEKRENGMLTVFYPIFPVERVPESADDEESETEKLVRLETPKQLVVIMTKRYRSVTKLRRTPSFAESIDGYVVGGKGDLSGNVMELVHWNMPGASNKKVIIFQEGPPWGTFPFWTLKLFGGLVAALVAMSIPLGGDESEEEEIVPREL